MASPQLEDGYTRIANELLAAICQFPFSKRQLKVMLAITRRTYGFHKKEDDVTVTQLAADVALTRSHTSEAIAELEQIGAVLKRDGQYGYVLGINKDYAKWRPSRNGTPRPKTGRPVPKQDAEPTQAVDNPANEYSSTPSQNGTRPETGHVPKRDGGRPETGHGPSRNGTRTVPKRDTQKIFPKDIPKRYSPKDIHSARETAVRILEHLNLKAGRNYHAVDVHIEMIQARLAEGFAEAQCLAVVDRQVAKWLHDDQMAQYLRPATLFNRTKFAQYVGELHAPLPRGSPPLNRQEALEDRNRAVARRWAEKKQREREMGNA